MNDSLAPLFTVLVPTIGRALLHFLWQGAVIGLVAALLLHVLRVARPQARYAIACMALLACALAPIADIAWQLGHAQAAVVLMPLTPVQGVPMRSLPAMVLAPMLGNATQMLAQAWRLDDALPAIVAVWAAGACVLSLRLAMGVWAIQRLCAMPQGDAWAAWQARLDALAPRFGIRHPVALRLVDTLVSPATVGWWRPVVLLPTALLTRMPVELVEALLAHELAHVRRHDFLVNLLQGAVEALLFYHPVTWWLSRRIRIEREQVADRLAANVLAAPRRLAVALSELSELSDLTDRPPSLALAAHGGHLMSRIEQLVRPSPHRSGDGRIAFPLLGLAAACLAFMAHAQSSDTTATPTAIAQAVPAHEMRAHAMTSTSAPSRFVGLHGDGHSRDASYALVRKGQNGITMSGNVGDAKAIEAMRRDIDSDFLWFRKNNKQWVITDPSTLDRAERAWAAMAPLDQQMEGLDAQMEVHDRKMEALDAQMERLSGQQESHPEVDAASNRMEELGRQQERLAGKQEQLAAAMTHADDAHQEQLSRQMEALSAQQEALSQQMDAQSHAVEAASARVEQNAKPMEALGRQMEEAGKPMEALGKQMDAIGKQMDAVSQKAEHETLQLIDDAVAKGLAKPAPMRR